MDDHPVNIKVMDTESLELAEKDFADYLHNLEEYEEWLARGEIQW